MGNKVWVPIWGTNKKVLLDTDPAGTAVLGENVYIRSSSGDGSLVPVASSDVLFTGYAQAEAMTTVKADTKVTGTPTSRVPPASGSPLTAKGDIYVFGPSNTRLPVGTDGQVLTADSTVPKGLSWKTIAAGGSPSISVNQNSHGFSVGQVVLYNGSFYALAKADNATNAEVVGMVSAVANANTFTLLLVGPVTLSGLTIGPYWLSTTTAGALSTTDPNVSGSIGQVSKPLGFAVSATQFLYVPMRGDVLTSAVSNQGWITTTTTTSMVSNGRYISNGASQITHLLPSTPSVGDEIKIDGRGSGGWKITQNARQVIHGVAGDTTTGTGGSIATTNRYSCVTLRCTVSPTDWVTESLTGSVTIV